MVAGRTQRRRARRRFRVVRLIKYSFPYPAVS
jgi:hypothetical protein